MKRSILMLMAIAVALIFFGCAKEEILPPDLEQDALEESALKGAKVNKPAKFIGTSIPVINTAEPNNFGIPTALPNGQTLVEGVSVEWYDEASDWRVTGKSVWKADYVWDGDPYISHGIIEGTCEIFVGLQNPDSPGYDPDALPVGKWEITWTGEQIVNPDGSFEMVAYAYGVGTEGVVKGLRAKWIDTFDFVNFRYNTEGYIKHANKGQHKKRHH